MDALRTVAVVRGAAIVRFCSAGLARKQGEASLLTLQLLRQSRGRHSKTQTVFQVQAKTLLLNWLPEKRLEKGAQKRVQGFVVEVKILIQLVRDGLNEAERASPPDMSTGTQQFVAF